MEPADLARYGSTASDVTWAIGDIAVKPRSGIVRIAETRTMAGDAVLVIEPVRVFAPLDNLRVIPVRAAAVHLAPVVDAARAAELVSLLSGPCEAYVAGGPDARRERCARTLQLGELARLRLALHCLYAEPHRPADEYWIIESLEGIVVGELACALDRPFEALRDELRAAHPRFADGAPARAPDGPPVARLGAAVTLFGEEARDDDGDDDATGRLALRTRPGRWLLDLDAGVLAHVEAAATADAATPIGELAPCVGNVWLIDAAFADAPDVDEERFNPIDYTLAGRGAHVYVRDHDRVAVRAVVECDEAVLIAIVPVTFDD